MQTKQRGTSGQVNPRFGDGRGTLACFSGMDKLFVRTWL